MARLIGQQIHIVITSPITGRELTFDLPLRYGDLAFRTTPRVVEPPEELSYMDGWSSDYVLGFCRGRDWTTRMIDTWDPPIVPIAGVAGEPE